VFIDACHHPLLATPFEITRENALDLLSLCDEFHAISVQAQVQAFLDSNAHSMLLPAVKRSLEHGHDTSGLEHRLKSNLSDFLDEADLRTLPLSFLARVISFGDRAAVDELKFDRIFRFCLRVLDERGASASVLFHGLDLRQCSAGQLHELHSRDSFLWALVADSVPAALIGLPSAAAEFRELFAAEHSEVERLTAQHREMVALCARQGEKLDALTARVAAIECFGSVRFFPLKIGPPPDGIVAYLTRKHGGNPAAKGAVAVTLSGKYENHRMGPNALDLATDTDACAGTTADSAQYIDFDFRAMRVRPTHYWIRSYCVGSAHLKSWALQCVDDLGPPIELDRRTNTSELNGRGKAASFEIAHPTRCRVIRLISTDSTHYPGNWRVIISGFELFGYLLE
jgi:hypothetical protein